MRPSAPRALSSLAASGDDATPSKPARSAGEASAKVTKPKSTGKRGRPPMDPSQRKTPKVYVPTGKPRGRPKGSGKKKGTPAAAALMAKARAARGTSDAGAGKAKAAAKKGSTPAKGGPKAGGRKSLSKKEKEAEEEKEEDEEELDESES